MYVSFKVLNFQINDKKFAYDCLRIMEIVQVRGCRCHRLSSLFGGRRLSVRAFSAFGSLWLALIAIAIAIVLDLGLLGAGRALGRGTRAGSEHRRRREPGAEERARGSDEMRWRK